MKFNHETGSFGQSSEVLTLFAEFTEFPTDIKIWQLKYFVEGEWEEEDNIDFFKNMIESLSVEQVDLKLN